MRNLLVYLAGSMTGQPAEVANNWRNYISKKCCETQFSFLSPMRGKDHLVGKEIIKAHYSQHTSTPKAIVTRDFFDVKRADVIFCNLIGDKIASIGTVSELAWAFLLQKPVIVCIEDNSIYKNHPFIIEFSKFIAKDLDEGISILQKVI